MQITTRTTRAMSACLLAASMVLAFSGCSKEADQTDATTGITEKDAVELSTDAILPSYGGLVAQEAASMGVFATVPFTCGLKKDTSFSRFSASGARPVYSFVMNWSSLLGCVAGLPAQLAINYNGNSTFDGPRLSFDGKSTGTTVITGLLPITSVYTVNTLFTRVGSFTFKTANNLSVSSTLTIQSSNITINKNTYLIMSGSAAVNITGTSSTGAAYNFSGTLTFLGNNKATLVLNSGVPYAIEW